MHKNEAEVTSGAPARLGPTPRSPALDTSDSPSRTHARTLSSRPDQQASLITAAGVGHHLNSPLIGRRAQLRTADDGCVNDLDSRRSGGRVFTPTVATFQTALYLPKTRTDPGKHAPPKNGSRMRLKRKPGAEPGAKPGAKPGAERAAAPADADASTFNSNTFAAPNSRVSSSTNGL